MRPVLSCTLVAVAFGTLSADDKKDEKIDAKKLIGRWQGEAIGIKTEDGKSKSLIDYTADGVIKLQVILGSVRFESEGKYTLDGNKLTIISKLPGGKEGKDVATITKLTDTDLEWRNSAGNTESFKRVKEEKK